MTEIEYDNQIWTVFSVGIISSVIILYYAHDDKLSGDIGIWALTIGFFVLIYSFILILGYNVKKSIHLANEDILRSQILSRRWYPRTRCMAEIILGLIGAYYFINFIERGYIYLSIFILLIAIMLYLIANLRAIRN